MFYDNFIATIGVDFRIKTMNISDQIVKLQIWDTAGQERFKSITTSYYRTSNGILVVFDLTRRESFEHVTFWLNEIDSHGDPKVKKILVGNKSDLKSERAVSKSEGESLALQYGMKYFESSAKENLNVEEIFKAICLSIYDTKKMAIKDDLVVTIPNSKKLKQCNC